MSKWRHREYEDGCCILCPDPWPCDAERMRLQFGAAAEERNQLAVKYETLSAEARRALDGLEKLGHSSAWCCIRPQPHNHTKGGIAYQRKIPCGCQCGLENIKTDLSAALGEDEAK